MTRLDRGLLLRIVYAVCLLGATFNHAQMLVVHGLFWNYGGMPVATTLFWTSLTLIDPLAALLLLIRPKLGVITTLLIMVADVLHNSWLTFIYFGAPLRRATLDRDLPLAEQIVFLVFVILTARMAYAGRRP